MVAHIKVEAVCWKTRQRTKRLTHDLAWEVDAVVGALKHEIPKYLMENQLEAHILVSLHPVPLDHRALVKHW